jgi:hypothetical protein
MDELSVLETGLVKLKTQRKTIIDTNKVKCEITMTKIKLTSNSRPHKHFIKHIADVFKKPL